MSRGDKASHVRWVERMRSVGPVRLAQPEQPRRIAVVDGDGGTHVTVRAALEGVGWQVESYLSAAEAIAAIPRNPPNAVLMDIQLPDANGLALLRKLKTLCPRVRIVILAARDDPAGVLDSLAAGADGYLVRPQRVPELLRALEAAVSGDLLLCPEARRGLVQFVKEHRLAQSGAISLTPRQNQVLALEAQGLSYKQIAAELGITVSTVKNHLSNIRDKLGAHSAFEAMRGAGLLG
jgi:DNA-binding NarL/FixJ family response regulator